MFSWFKRKKSPEEAPVAYIPPEPPSSDTEQEALDDDSLCPEFEVVEPDTNPINFMEVSGPFPDFLDESAENNIILSIFNKFYSEVLFENLEISRFTYTHEINGEEYKFDHIVTTQILWSEDRWEFYNALLGREATKRISNTWTIGARRQGSLYTIEFSSADKHQLKETRHAVFANIWATFQEKIGSCSHADEMVNLMCELINTYAIRSADVISGLDKDPFRLTEAIIKLSSTTTKE